MVIGTDKIAGDAVNLRDEGTWPGIDSRFRLIVVSALRSKQLQRGSLPRITADPLKRRNTSIALEEVKRGLVSFTLIPEQTGKAADNENPIAYDERD